MPVALALPDDQLVAPKSRLPRTCILLSVPGGPTLFWNSLGTNAAAAYSSVVTFCAVTGVPPVTRAPPLGVAPTPNPPLAPGVTSPPFSALTPLPVFGPTAAPRTPPTPAPPTPAPPRGPAVVRVEAMLRGTGGAGQCLDEEVANVPDGQRSASSAWQGCPGGPCPGVPGVSQFHKGRLDSNAGWAAGSGTLGQYYELDAGELSVVQGVVMQGGRAPTFDPEAWVTDATVEVSPDHMFWTEVNGGRSMNASTSFNEQAVVRFPVAVAARYVRIKPTKWKRWPALRAGLMLCIERDVDVRAIQVTFSEPTHLGVQRNRTIGSPRGNGYTVLGLFGVRGHLQSLGRPEGIYGAWIGDSVYEITLGESYFNGYVDPVVASLYLNQGSGVRSVAGGPATLFGPQNAVPFSGDLRPPPRRLQPPPPPPRADGDGDEDGFPVAEVVLVCVLLAVVIVPVFLYFIFRMCRGSSAASEHRAYIDRSLADAADRWPGGAAGIRRRGIVPRPASPVNPIGAAFPSTDTAPIPSRPRVRNYIYSGSPGPVTA
eukprot:TRINITY_DN2565_c0_g1_i1.p1 TRINITY_DN2565_c0_g1~~TRINITY_DN2565_c0_g1_i1.p1  ORF type:complete len:615 (+),score=101.23 TRINITY_DN2565_c0_g1_i1:224-1846(+)